MHTGMQQAVTEQAVDFSISGRRTAIGTIAKRLAFGSEKRFAVAVIDLENLKNVNDALGYEAGDQVLEIAHRRMTEIGGAYGVCRLGSDEFVVLIDLGGHCDKAAQNFGSAIMRSLTRPYKLTRGDIALSATVGVSIFPKNGRDPETLIQHASTALGAAKNRGGRCVRLYSPDQSEAALRKMQITAGFRRAIRDKQFSTLFQPQVHADTGACFGAEALVRWRDGVSDIWYPNEFIPIAETTGDIIPIGRIVLDQALMAAAEWRLAGKNIKVAVNISAKQIHDHSIVSDIKKALGRWKVPASQLEIEITETVLMNDLGPAIEILGELSALGVTVALDDFGTGASSLVYLARLPIHILKVDKSFVDALGNPVNDKILNAIVGMSHDLGIQVLAEGVETEEQKKTLMDMGMNKMQGYLFARPTKLLPEDMAISC